MSPGKFARSSLDVAGSYKEGSHLLPDRLDVRESSTFGQEGDERPRGKEQSLLVESLRPPSSVPSIDPWTHISR